MRIIMAKLIWQWFSFSLCLIICVPNLKSADWSIVVDGSGSMKNFFVAGELQAYISQLKQKVEKDNSVKLDVLSFLHFNSNGRFEHRFVQYTAKPNIYGSHTDLEQAFVDIAAKNTKAVILITDNLASTPDEKSNTKSFYSRLIDDKVKQVHVVPKFFAFSGKSQKSGVMIYCFLFDDSFSYQFSQIRSYFGAEELLLIKPITNKEIKLMSSEYKQNKPNSIIKNGFLKPITSNMFNLNKKNTIKFNINLRSELPHIKINSKGADNSEVNLSLRNINLSSNNQLVKFHLHEGSISPKLLQGDLIPGNTSSTVYESKIVFSPKLNLSFSNIWKSTSFSWSNFAFRDIRFNVSSCLTLNVPPKCFALTDEYKNRFFSNRIEAGKIFSPVDLVEFINSKNVDIDLMIESK